MPSPSAGPGTRMRTVVGSAPLRRLTVSGVVSTSANEFATVDLNAVEILEADVRIHRSGSPPQGKRSSEREPFRSRRSRTLSDVKLGALIALDVLLLIVSGWFVGEGIASQTSSARHTVAWIAFLTLLVLLVVLIGVGIYRGFRGSADRS